MNLRRTVRWLALLVAVLVLLLVAAGFWVARGGSPLRAGERRLSGLAAPVQIRFDARGVPAVSAESAHDAAFALGWLHANDRLFQMELTRRAASGRLAELFGERALGHDRRVVRLGFRGALRRLEASVAPATRAEIEAYAAGVNAWLGERGRDLPPEFRILRARPEPWRLEDTLGVLFVMARQLSPVVEPNEEELFRLLAAFGPELEGVISRDPTQMVAYKLLVEAHLAEGDGEEARKRLRIYSLLNDSDPEIAELRRRIGEAGRHRRDPEDTFIGSLREENAPAPKAGGPVVGEPPAHPPVSVRLDSAIVVAEPTAAEPPVETPAVFDELVFPDLGLDPARYLAALSTDAIFDLSPGLVPVAALGRPSPRSPSPRRAS